MRSARLLVCIVAIAGGLAAGSVLVPRALHGLHALTFSTLTAPDPHASGARRGPNHRAGHHSGATACRWPDRRLHEPAELAVAAHRGTGSFALLAKVAKLIALASRCSSWRACSWRFAARGTAAPAQYALYQLHLSTHDQAKGQDLEDMVEQIANIVRAWPADRARNGQPYFALELICGTR